MKEEEYTQGRESEKTRGSWKHKLKRERTAPEKVFYLPKIRKATERR